MLAGADLSQLADGANQVEVLTARIAQHHAAIERHHAAMRRADTAYVNGVMDEDRYKDQVNRLQVAVAAEQASAEQLRAMIADEQSRGNRRDRLEEMIANGYRWLDDADAAAANAFLRPRVRVWCAHNRVVNVEFL